MPSDLRFYRETLTLLRQAAAGDLGDAVTLGSIALGCALGYLDLRFPDDKWRDGRPALAGWFEAFNQRPSMQKTMPPAA